MKRTPENAVIGNNIAVIREHRERSQTWLAQEITTPGLRINPAAVCKMEKNNQVIPAFLIPAIARSLDIPVDFLVGERLTPESARIKLEQYKQSEQLLKDTRQALLILAQRIEFMNGVPNSVLAEVAA